MVRKIAVFGSAGVQPGDEAYDKSEQVGRLLAEAGFTVVTGGYAGVMAAASKGAAEAGGHVIGITVAEIEAVRASQVNQWVSEEIRYETLVDRLRHLVTQSDGYVAMPGGIGTLQEIADTWQHLRLDILPRRPFVCYGPFWYETLRPIIDSHYIGARDREFIRFASTPAAILDQLQTWPGGG